MKNYLVTFKLLNDKKEYTLDVFAANREVVPVKLSQKIEKPQSLISIIKIKLVSI